VAVILGANAELLEKAVQDKKIHIAINKEWNEGMASSVRCGIRTLTKIAPAADAAIVMVCDQPFVTSTLLNDLFVTQRNTGKSIVACKYETAIGAPALFHKSVFPELLELKGDAGARKIIERRKGEIATISFEKGIIDVDTEDDYNALKDS
jgi:molybdenum cofactor cytidylyltransferase